VRINHPDDFCHHTRHNGGGQHLARPNFLIGQEFVERKNTTTNRQVIVIRMMKKLRMSFTVWK
jgi:hypothetical protein